jgi:hypothetical protein
MFGYSFLFNFLSMYVFAEYIDKKIESASVRAVNGIRGRIFSNIPESLRLYEQPAVPGEEYSAIYLN